MYLFLLIIHWNHFSYIKHNKCPNTAIYILNIVPLLSFESFQSQIILLILKLFKNICICLVYQCYIGIIGLHKT